MTLAPNPTPQEDNPRNSQRRPLLDTAALGRELGKSAAALRIMYRRSPEALPPAIRVGKRLMWHPDHVDSWFEQQRLEGDGT